MNFTRIALPKDIDNSLYSIYERLKELHPTLTRNELLVSITKEWLDKRTKPISYQKNNVILVNKIPEALKVAGKSKKQVGIEIGVDRTYIGRIANSQYEPSVTLALLIANATGHKVDDVFYLKPTGE